MFKGMYESIGKVKKDKESKNNIVVQKDAAPILAHDNLLSTEKRQQILQDIRALLTLPDEEYDRIFLSVIKNFAEFVQNVPETERSYYSSLGGMLEHGLERASLSLFLCRTYLLPENATLSSLSEEELRWVYAVFTAALLLDVGKIATQHIITLTDEQSNAVKTWLPYAGTMVGQASHYIFGFSEEYHDHMRHMVTPLLARQILPETGFNWLAEDPDVLESWLALLNDDVRQVGSLLTIIPIADAQLLESYFTDRKIFRHALSPQTIALLNKLNKDRKAALQQKKEIQEKMLSEHADKELYKNAEKMNDKQLIEQPKTTKQAMFGFPSVSQQKTAAIGAAALTNENIRDIANQFKDWLQQKISNNSISNNQANTGVHVSGERVAITQQVLQNFLSENRAMHLNAQQLQQVLIQSALANPVSYTEVVQNWQKTGVAPEGLLRINPLVAFPNGVPPLAAALGNQLQQPSQPTQQTQTQPPTSAEQYQANLQAQQQKNIPTSYPPKPGFSKP